MTDYNYYYSMSYNKVSLAIGGHVKLYINDVCLFNVGTNMTFVVVVLVISLTPLCSQCHTGSHFKKDVVQKMLLVSHNTVTVYIYNICLIKWCL